MSRYQAVRGTFDLLPEQLPTWNRLEQAARELAERFGYSEIRTPLFEEAELFTRGMGVLAGIVERELWTFHDKFGKKLALRADMTTGVVRAYQQHGLGEQSGALVKLYYLAPVFLLGKDSESGSRQSHQFGVEALGTDSPAIDAEVIALASSFCNDVGLDGHVVELNSLGGAKCRPAYEDNLRDYFNSHAGELCPTCKRKYKTHPTWVLSCEEPGCVRLSQVAPTIYGILSPECRSHFNCVKEYLEDMEIPFELNPRVIRDLEYYNRTIFQIRCGDKVVGFGGRYDGLVEVLGGKPTPAIGFAISLETVLDLLSQKEDGLDEPEPPTVFLEPEGAEATKVMVPILQKLRRLGVRAEMSYGNGRGAQPARKRAARVVVTLAEANAFRGHAMVEDRDEGSNEKVLASRLSDRLASYLGVEDEAEDRSGGRRKLTRKSRRRGQDDRDRDRDRGRRKERTQEQPRKSEPSRAEAVETDTQEREEGRSRKRRRRRRGEEAPVAPERPRDAEKTREPKRSRDAGRSRDSERTREPARSRGSERASERVSERASEGDGEKAFIPALFLGGEPEAAPRKTSGSERPRKQKDAPPPVPEMTSSGLNWSIAPVGLSRSSSEDQEGGTGKAKRERRTRASRKKSEDENS